MKSLIALALLLLAACGPSAEDQNIARLFAQQSHRCQMGDQNVCEDVRMDLALLAIKAQPAPISTMPAYQQPQLTRCNAAGTGMDCWSY
jgi:hypothetical protein